MQKLPLSATWYASLILPWQHAGVFIRIMWPWILAGGAVYAVSFIGSAAALTDPSQAVQVSLIAAAIGVVAFVLVSPAMVAALRFVITGEAKLHGFGKRTRSFVIAYLTLMVFWFPIMSLSIFAGQTVTPAGDVTFQRPDLMSYFVVLTLIALPIYMRLGFVFPAVVDDEPIDFALAWGRTKGNTIRLLFGYVTLVVGIVIVGFIAIAIIGLIMASFLPNSAGFMLSVTAVLYVVFVAYLLACLLSWFGLAYLALKPNRPGPATSVPNTDGGGPGVGG